MCVREIVHVRASCVVRVCVRASMHAYVGVCEGVVIQLHGLKCIHIANLIQSLYLSKF